MTWIANLLVLIGLYLTGRKVRSCFLFTAAGELVWTVCSAVEGRWDLSSICGLFTVLALYNYRQWSKEDNDAASTGLSGDGGER